LVQGLVELFVERFMVYSETNSFIGTGSFDSCGNEARPLLSEDVDYVLDVDSSLLGLIGSPSWTSSLLLVSGKEIGFGGNIIRNL
jgi:hypothetical protein